MCLTSWWTSPRKEGYEALAREALAREAPAPGKAPAPPAPPELPRPEPFAHLAVPFARAVEFRRRRREAEAAAARARLVAETVAAFRGRDLSPESADWDDDGCVFLVDVHYDEHYADTGIAYRDFMFQTGGSWSRDTEAELAPFRLACDATTERPFAWRFYAYLETPHNRHRGFRKVAALEPRAGAASVSSNPEDSPSPSARPDAGN